MIKSMYYPVSFWTTNTTKHKSQCFLCWKILANGGMKTEKLKECDVCVPPENVFKDAGFFVFFCFFFMWGKLNSKKLDYFQHLDLLLHKKLLLKHLSYQRAKEKSPTLVRRHVRQGHGHRHYWATFWIGSGENTGSRSLDKWCDVFQTRRRLL